MNFDEICRVFESKDAIRFDLAAASLLHDLKEIQSPAKVARLATALAASGDRLLLGDEFHQKADVPSTGAPASMSTLLCPVLIASQSIYVPKLSASGSVAGSIDSMALIPGFKARLDTDEFLAALRDSHFAHSIQTGRFCPADGSLIKARRAANMMANPFLAAASLIGKKLVVPGTAAAFDFRVGPTGNIAVDYADANAATRIFFEVAALLNVKIGIGLTDNRTFPCSALGRLESLNLLLDMLNPTANIIHLDELHLESCILLASEACSLGATGKNREEWRAAITSSIKNGAALACLERHLRSQGTTPETLAQFLRSDSRSAKSLTAVASGYWIPPELSLAKDYIKAQQAVLSSSASTAAYNEFGLQLLVTPGTRVSEGDEVLKIKSPDASLLNATPGWLAGQIVTDEPQKSMPLTFARAN